MKRIDNVFPAESRFRIAIAWISWWLFLWLVGICGTYLITYIGLFFQGGSDLALEVNKKEDEGVAFGILLSSLFIGFPFGAWSGLWLWAKLMRKIDFISGDRIKQMSGF